MGKYDSTEDIRTAFICITESIDGSIRSPADLTKALQRCGRNPTEKQVDNYWNSYRGNPKKT